MSYFFKDLVVWQEAKAFALEVYDISDSLPRREIYGMTSQVRRAAVSVPSNIAEGQGRLTKGEFIQFLGHARGSLLETVTQLEIAADRKYLDKERLIAIEQKAFQVLRLLNALIDSLRNSRARGAGALAEVLQLKRLSPKRLTLKRFIPKRIFVTRLSSSYTH